MKNTVRDSVSVGGETFGTHLTLDLSKCNISTLENYELIFNMLQELPILIKMHSITQPYVFPYSGFIPEDCGITGVVILAESHCSIHTFSKKDFVFVDVFSCNCFDTEIATKYFTDKFEAKSVVKNIVQRGLGFRRS